MFDSAPHPPPRKLLSPAGGGPAATATPPLVRPSHQRPPYSAPRTAALRGFSPARSISPSGTLAAAPAGRPPLLGRQGSSPLTLAQQPSSLLLAGRQSPAANSPLLLHKGLAAAAASNSPAMRRQRKVPALGRLQQTAMRKSLSLDSVAVTTAAAAHLSQQLPEREGEDRSGGQNHRYPREDVEETDSGGGGGHPAQREEDPDDVDDGDGDGETRTRSGPESPPPLSSSTLDVPVIRFQEVVSARGDPHLAAAFSSTLPRPLSRHRNISRSLVPKMRRMFEKARSADPDFSPPPSPLRLTVPAGTAGEDDSAVSPPRPAMMGHQDGTESARSSFVLLGPDGGGCGGRSESSLADSSLELSEGSPVLADRKGARSGFVNKCVTKVKSFMGKSQDRL
jgi:hypothetical protein